MPEILSLYRIHGGGIWQGATETKRRIEGSIEYNFFRKYYRNTKYFSFFNKNFGNFYASMMHYLILNTHMSETYPLAEKETKLLTDLFEDLAKEKIPFVAMNAPKLCEYKEQVSFSKRVVRKLKRLLCK